MLAEGDPYIPAGSEAPPRGGVPVRFFGNLPIFLSRTAAQVATGHHPVLSCRATFASLAAHTRTLGIDGPARSVAVART